RWLPSAKDLTPRTPRKAGGNLGRRSLSEMCRLRDLEVLLNVLALLILEAVTDLKEAKLYRRMV
ncbi:MAG: hypothetical protein ABJD83_08420, partial [Roseobacter sp.]